MKNLLIVGFLTLISWGDKKLHKRFVGGRSMYSSIELKLYSDSLYTFKKWAHVGYSCYDTGCWVDLDSALVLKSISTHTYEKERYVYKKRFLRRDLKKSRFVRFDSGRKKFNHDPFRLKDDILFLFDEDNLNDDQDSSFYLAYYTLILKNEND
jgi:hypothetical protein